MNSRASSKSSLLDTIFLSEKRKNLLLFLNEEGPKSSDEIKSAFDFPWKSMIPQIRKLMDWDLVVQEDDVYALSDMGGVIATNARFLLENLAVYEENREFWSEHDLSSIPFHLLTRVGELGCCKVLKQDLSQAFRIPEDILQNILDSNRVMTFVSVFHPSSPLLFSEYLGRGTDVTVILTNPVLETLREECVSDLPLLKSSNPIFKKALLEYKHEIKHMLTSENSNLFVYEGDTMPMSMIVTDKVFFLSLLDKKGRSTNRVLMASEARALKWGEELFLYYKGRSGQLSTSETPL